MILKDANVTLEYERVGSGPLVVLFHSTASSLKQWNSLINMLKSDFEIIAVNLIGYGLTNKWTENNKQQNLIDHVKLVEPLIRNYKGKVNFIGHSFGGSVAIRAALEYKKKLNNLILLEPNAFFILDKKQHSSSYNIAHSFGKKIYEAQKKSNWNNFAKIFLEFWVGIGSWEKMTPKQQHNFLLVIPNIYYEAQSIFNEKMDLKELNNFQKNIFFINAKNTNFISKEIKRVFISILPEIIHTEIEEGDHMAPIKYPEIINPLIYQHLKN
ncbi:MAG: alpha/beta hydrolase [Paracoccaceae bacterium]